MNFIKNLFGNATETDYAQLLKEGGVIVDVRSEGEYAGGHIKGSINIPLGSLSNNIKKLNKNKPVITCCASGMRSASAKSMLTSNGFTNVVNGGGWSSLQAKLTK